MLTCATAVTSYVKGSRQPAQATASTAPRCRSRHFGTRRPRGRILNPQSHLAWRLYLIKNTKQKGKKKRRRRRRRERTKVGRKMNSVVRIVEGPARVRLQRDTSKTCPYSQKNSISQNSYVWGQDEGNVEGGERLS